MHNTLHNKYTQKIKQNTQYIIFTLYRYAHYSVSVISHWANACLLMFFTVMTDIKMVFLLKRGIRQTLWESCRYVTLVLLSKNRRHVSDVIVSCLSGAGDAESVVSAGVRDVYGDRTRSHERVLGYLSFRRAGGDGYDNCDVTLLCVCSWGFWWL